MSKQSSNSTQNNKKMRNSRFLETLSYQGNFKIPTSIELIQYDGKYFSEKQIPITVNLKSEISKDVVNWFKITGISEAQTIYNICKSFGIQRFDIKDLLSYNQVTKVIVYEHVTFILMSGCIMNDPFGTNLHQVAFILGDNYIISFQETPDPIFDDIKEAIRSSKIGIREKGADFLLYLLLNDVHLSYNESLMKLTDTISEMEDRLIDDDTQGMNVMKFIQARKKEYSLLKRSISAMREEYINLLHNTNRLIRNDNMVYFNDFDDRLRTSLDDLEMFHISISSMTDLYFNNNNLRMNNVIKKLTIVSTIFIPLTFMVGVWGMNFEYMPELKWMHGYLFAWGIMIVMVVLAIFFLKHKKWF